VPEELSLIGYDNIFLSGMSDPPLTTVAQPTRQMGQRAAEMLIAMLEGQSYESKVVFDGELIIRGTT